MLNVTVLMGRITKEPELRYTTNDVPVTSITLAVERDYAPKGQNRQADFIDVIGWRGTAEFICKYFKKGQLIAVKGSIHTRSYTDKDGNKRKAFEIIADTVHFAGSKPVENPDADTPSDQAAEPGGVANEDISEFPPEDDLPF